jgi:hypothetical protein
MFISHISHISHKATDDDTYAVQHVHMKKDAEWQAFFKHGPGKGCKTIKRVFDTMDTMDTMDTGCPRPDL